MADRIADKLVIRGQKELHVADLLLFVLPVKLLTINTCCRVADFSDLCVNGWQQACAHGRIVIGCNET
jgi:hypothetical protein